MEEQWALAPPSLDPPPASSSLIFLVLCGWRLLVSTHPAVAAQLVAVVDAFLLGQRETLPPLVEVAQPRVDLAVVHSTWGGKEWRRQVNTLSHKLNLWATFGFDERYFWSATWELGSFLLFLGLLGFHSYILIQVSTPDSCPPGSVDRTSLFCRHEIRQVLKQVLSWKDILGMWGADWK